MKFPQQPKDDQEERPEEGSGHPRLFFLRTFNHRPWRGSSSMRELAL